MSLALLADAAFSSGGDSLPIVAFMVRIGFPFMVLIGFVSWMVLPPRGRRP